VERVGKLDVTSGAPAQATSLRPLGLRPDALVGPAKLAGLGVIESYDLSAVRNRLVSHGAMLPRWADEAVFEFRRYLALRLVAGHPIFMLSGNVDEVWHTCLLFTRRYADLCDRAFGYFVHHDPEEEPVRDRHAAWREFETAYRPLFGEPTMLWQIWRPIDSGEEAVSSEGGMQRVTQEHTTQDGREQQS